ncbi:enoyl-CoA hydratase/carnithine racemase [Novosphingobium sp. PhB165]|uniref:enoyl-CoA hydratase/isomerase family protein n=1 Tax=Novosphingobium sp. PhB165 TaxID=2485105 RepID=UPI001046B89E|nr:enoyl-CoA hydratase/isomerase family protein [Novosphingobium sp. PhB165]TCM21807.1 enoyl-CoA hydratase/carnithine racemase [Novosphingobium sp. PhB165]
MRPEDLTFPAAEIAEIAGAEAPIAFVDLARESRDGVPIALPPCPVIGIGPREHPLSARLDAVLEPRFDASQLVVGAMAQPLAVMVVTQLLRALPSLPVAEALTMESLAYATLQGSEAHRRWIAGRERAASAEGAVLLSREDDILTITLDRPAAGNAIDRVMRDALHEAFALANVDSTISRVVLRARGKAFSLGAELAEFGTTTDPVEAHRIRCLTLPGREAAQCSDRFEAEVDGACIGAGLELAAFASRIVATPRSWFQLPELAMGILPGAGGCVSLSRRIGRQRTLLMILSGRRLTAREALDWGLVDALVDEFP